MIARDVLPVEIFSIVAFTICNVSPQYPEINCLIIPCGCLFRNKMWIYQIIYIPVSLRKASGIPEAFLLVGQVGIEPTVYLTSRFYRPLQSPAMRTDPYGGTGWN